MKYLKVMFGTTSGANSNLEYKLNEVSAANNWNSKSYNSSIELLKYYLFN